jgi:hypothetical protein
MDIPVRMRQIRTNNQNGESQIGLARQARSTSCIHAEKRINLGCSADYNMRYRRHMLYCQNSKE